MDTVPFEPLRSALRDRSNWVRMGAATALHYLAPDHAAALLTERANTLRAVDTPPEEIAVLAVELARTGSDKAVPLAANLFKDDSENVLNVLNARDKGRWTDYIEARARIAGLSDRSREMVTPYLNTWTDRSQKVAVVPQPTSDADRTKNALNALYYWQNVYAGEGTSVHSLSEKKFGLTIKCLNAFDIPRARDELVAVAITEPDPVIRNIACHALPTFGLDASAHLLATLSGEPGLQPRRDVYASIKQEARGVRLKGMKRWQLAAFFAAEALQEFNDYDTARAMTSAAIAWQGTPQARVARVLAHMPVEAALPELAWSSLNLPEASGRQAAHKLLDRIVTRDRNLGINAHRFGLADVISGELGWVAEIAGREPNKRDWTADPDIAVPVLREAIGLMPRDVRPVGSGDTAPTTTLSRASDFAQSMPTVGFIDTVKKTFGFGGAASRPAAKLQRHPHAQFPERCHRGDQVALAVRLLPTATDGTRQPFDVPFAEGQETTELLVLVHSQGFDVRETHGILHVPRDGPSDTATFHLRAREIGQWVLDIKFMLGTAELSHCIVPSEVTEAATSGNAVINPVERFTEESLHRQGEASAVLIVMTNRDTEKLVWSLLEPGAKKPRALGCSPQRFNNTETDKWNKQHAQFVKDLIEKDLTDLDGALAYIAGIGNGLFEQVAPPSVADELAKLRDDALVVVESDADWVPWELLATDSAGPPLGQRFVLVRAPQVTERPNAPPVAPIAVPATLESALVVVGDKINDAKHLHERTFGTYSNRARPPLVEPDWDKLKSNVKDKDIVHFVCHGRGETFHLSYGADPGSRLSVKQVNRLGLKPGAVVFANACQSGAAAPLLADFQSFGREFYLAGARPYIGSLGPVPESLAVEFSAIFYRYFALEGLSAAQALRMARREAAKTFKRPLWLFYCLYGNTSVARRWSAAA